MTRLTLFIVGFVTMFATTLFFSYQLSVSEQERYNLECRLETAESALNVWRYERAQDYWMDRALQDKPRDVE